MDTTAGKPLYYDGSGSLSLQMDTTKTGKQIVIKPDVKSTVPIPYFPYFKQ